MLRSRLSALSVACLVLGPHVAQAQDLSRYREFQLGMTLAAVAEQTRLPVSMARTLYQRPRLIQDLEWQPQRTSATPQTEAVRTVRFSFYDGRLYQVIVAYDRARIEGLTAEDLVEAISASYGPALLQRTEIGFVPLPAAVDLSVGIDRTVAAEWGSAEYSVSLIHTNYPSGFSLVLRATQPERLARAAGVESERLDTLEAPQREIARQKKQVDEDRAKAEEARKVNKPTFRF